MSDITNPPIKIDQPATVDTTVYTGPPQTDDCIADSTGHGTTRWSLQPCTVDMPTTTIAEVGTPPTLPVELPATGADISLVVFAIIILALGILGLFAAALPDDPDWQADLDDWDGRRG